MLTDFALISLKYVYCIYQHLLRPLWNYLRKTKIKEYFTYNVSSMVNPLS